MPVHKVAAPSHVQTDREASAMVLTRLGSRPRTVDCVDG